VILTDREILIALDRGLITIRPRPEEDCFTSTAIDLTLDAHIALVRKPTPAIETIIDPRAPGFNAEAAMASLTDKETIKPNVGYPLPPRVLALAWTR
jgi:dCTP deaminase